VNDGTYRSWTEDRFMMFLVFAVVVHMALLFGVHFGFSMKPAKRLADTLDVVLVQWKSETRPEEADYLAQAAQQGGGEIQQKSRPVEEASGAVPTPSEGLEPVQAEPQIPVPTEQNREIVAVETVDAAPLPETVQERPELEQPTAEQLMQQSMNMARMNPEVSEMRREGSSMKRREWISASTREYEFASYMSAWVAKVERVGNLNYPAELRQQKLHGDLILTVGINQNGTVESIDVKRSSGVRDIDDAAVNIVQLAAPFAPLPDNIASRVDVLHITRTWRFETAFATEASIN
jgi:protein TonB